MIFRMRMRSLEWVMWQLIMWTKTSWPMIQQQANMFSKMLTVQTWLTKVVGKLSVDRNSSLDRQQHAWLTAQVHKFH